MVMAVSAVPRHLRYEVNIIYVTEMERCASEHSQTERDRTHQKLVNLDAYPDKLPITLQVIHSHGQK
jgi:hypothetical protein